MTDYLNDIEFAVTNLLPIIWGERNKLRELESKLARLTSQVRASYERSAAVADDDIGLATLIHWENYFGDDKGRFHMDKDRGALAAQVTLHTFSAGSLAGALLQLAKQGVSMVHTKPDNCPDGRNIGQSLNLKTVIWEGRNQSDHWEEGKPHPRVVQCFDTLAREVLQSFGDYKVRNMALDVVELLGWTDFTTFRDDMLLLA